MKSISLNRKRIVVTGGARGLGRAFAEAAVEAGASVVVADILEDVGRETVSDISKKGDAYFEGVDLGDPESIARLAQRSVQHLGGVDGLVNCAAIATDRGKMADEIDIETWDRVMTVNVRGTWLAVRAFSPALRDAGNEKSSTSRRIRQCGAHQNCFITSHRKALSSHDTASLAN